MLICEHKKIINFLRKKTDKIYSKTYNVQLVTLLIVKYKTAIFGPNYSRLLQNTFFLQRK